MFIPDAATVGNSGESIYYIFEIYSGNIFIVFVQIIIIMQHIVKQIKGISKKYETKDGIKESISKRVDIGVDETFEVGEYVAVISKTDFDNVEKNIADNNAKIDALNERIDKLKLEIETKTNKIGDLSKEIKALKTNVENLESDISAKDETIAELKTAADGDAATIGDLEKSVADKDSTIVGLNADVDELTATVDELKPLLLTKDSTIAKLEKQIAVYDAIDVDELKYKASELGKADKVIMKLQNEKIEYIQLVNYHKETATAYKNQNALSKLFGKDAAAEITTPDLVFIDLSGNPIVKDDDADETAIGNGDDSGKTTSPDEN